MEKPTQEIQVRQDTTTELVPTKIIKSPIKDAGIIYMQIKNGVKLMDEPNDVSLKQSLLYVFALLGLKQDSWPTELEKPVLHQAIFETFGFITAEEIKIAYKMAISGELFEEGKPINLKLYGDVYSFDHFSRVIRAYVSQKRKEVNHLINKELQKTSQEVSDDVKRQIRVKYLKNQIIEPIRRYANGKGQLDFGFLNPARVYREFYNAKLIRLSDDEVKAMKEKYTKEVNAEWQKKIKEPSITKEQKTLKDLMRNSLESKNNSFGVEVLRRCNIEAIKWVVSNHDLETIEEKLLA